MTEEHKRRSCIANFFGYQSLEEWASIVSKDEPIYACALTDPGVTDKIGVRMDKLVILAAQPDDNNNVHYWRFRTGYLQYANGRPFNTDFNERQERHRQAWEIVKDWLSEQGFTIRTAAVAMPTDYRFFEGSAYFLGYDKKSERYYRKENHTPSR